MDKISETVAHAYRGQTMKVEDHIRSEVLASEKATAPFVGVWIGELRTNTAESASSITFSVTQSTATFSGQTYDEVFAQAQAASRIEGSNTVRLLMIREDGLMPPAVLDALVRGPNGHIEERNE